MVGLLALAAWGFIPAQAAGIELAGTSWQLVRITSMDDNIDEPNDPAHYSLAFGTGELVEPGALDRIARPLPGTRPSGARLRRY